MPAWTVLIVVAALASALLHLWAEQRGRRGLVYTFKPVTTTLILVLALLLPAFDGIYRAAVVAGLLASLIGDIWLMLPRDRFVAGLASFLVAHVAYLVAFSRVAAFGATPWAFLAYGLAGAGLVALLWPRLGTLRLSVLGYTVALVLMAGQAGAHATAVGSIPARLAALGAGLFVASDALLAVNRFYRPIHHAQVWIMTTYVAAQLFIALSVLPPDWRP